MLAQLAVRYLRLPDPVIRSSPAPGALQLTRLPRVAVGRRERLAAAVQDRAGARRGGDGDGHPGVGGVVDGRRDARSPARGRGPPYAAGDNPAAASPTCGYTYDQSSAGQPGGAYRVTVTITWDITWQGTGGAGGALAPLQTVAAAEFRVAESQALNTSGG